MIPLSEDGRAHYDSCIGNQQIFWSIFSGLSLPKGIFDFIDDEDLIQLLTHQHFLSEVQARNPSVMAFLKNKTTLIRLPRILFGPSPLDFTLPLETKTVLFRDQNQLQKLASENKGIRAEMAAIIVQLFSSFEHTTDFIECYMTKEMLPNLLYVGYMSLQQEGRDKVIEHQMLIANFASLLKSIFQKDDRYKAFFTLLPTIEDGYILTKLIYFAPYPAIEDILIFMVIRRLKNAHYEQAIVAFLDKWNPLSTFANLLIGRREAHMPSSYLDGCKNYFIQFISQHTGPLATAVILSSSVKLIAKHIETAPSGEQLERLTEVWLCVVGQCLIRIQRLMMFYSQDILDKVRTETADLSLPFDDTTCIEDPDSHITISHELLEWAVKRPPSPAPELQPLLVGTHGEQLLQSIVEEAKSVMPYITVAKEFVQYISIYAQKLASLSKDPSDKASERFSLLLEYARFFARIVSIPASMKAHIYDILKGCGPTSEFNGTGVGVSNEIYLSLDGSQYAELPETALASVGGTSEVELKATSFLAGRVRLPYSPIEIIETIDKSGVPATLLDLLTTYRNGQCAHSSTLGFYVFRVFKILLAYSRFNSSLVTRVFSTHGMEDLIFSLCKPNLTPEQRSLLPFVHDFVLTAFRLAAGIPDMHLYMHKKRGVSLRGDSTSGQGRMFVPETVAQIEEMIYKMDEANMNLLMYLQESPVIKAFNDTYCAPLAARKNVFSDSIDASSSKGTDESGKKRYVADQSAIDSLTASLQSW